MNTTLLVILLALLLFFLVREWPSPDPARALAEQSSPPAPGSGWQLGRLDGWPRQALVAAASAAGGYLLAGEVLTAWFAVAAKIGAAIGLGPGWLTVILLGVGAAIVLGLRSRSGTAVRPVVAAPPVTASPPQAVAAPIAETPAPPAQPAFAQPAIAQPAEPSRIDALSGAPARKRSTALVVGTVAAVLAGLLLAGFFFYPALSPKLATPAGEPSAAAAPSDAPAAATPTAAATSSATQAAIERAIGDLADSARKARDARQDINGDLAESFAFAKANLPEIEIDRASFAIADREKDVGRARQQARQALSDLARAMSADDGGAYRAFMAAGSRPDIQNDPDIESLVTRLYRIEFPPDEPDRFVEAGMAMWESAIPARAQTPASPDQPAVPAASAVRERPAEVQRRVPFGENNRQRMAPSARPTYSEPRYSRQPGSARDRQRERHRGVEQLPPEEFQR